ncbi:hypothetical protein JZ751_026052 [Albula glossodonta]|uniref:Dendritic cell-specific transmembrane protein-like domain-containing protein n=1 Tax=Albula glossodonta TaxID=121402 RepID=A0A8T2NPD9_9TELE|nr:hypothetical protein JZ751_026052 [Albula glossodonta]
MQHVVQAWSVIVMHYTSAHRKGLRGHVLHFTACFTISLIFNTFLFLFLLYSLKWGIVVSGIITGACVVVTTTALFISKNVRCFGILFIIACGMKQGRNLFITAGTGLVVFWNVQNTFQNLRELARSMVCNLEKKRLSIDLTPLSNYVKILKWVGDQLKEIPIPGIHFHSELNVYNKTESQELKEKLQQAQKELNETLEHLLSVMDTVSSISQNLVPALGMILVVVVTVLYVRKFYHNIKFNNTFITSKFIQYDEKQKAEGKPHVLPLTKKEAKRYITIPSPRLTVKEGKTMLKFCFPVLTNLLIWVLFITIDALFYWLIVIIRTHLEQIEPFQVPLIMKKWQLNQEGSDEKGDFSFSVALFEKECLPEASLLLYQSVIPLTIILSCLIVLALLSAKLEQLKLLVSAEFFGDSADERVKYLHAKIIRKRAKTNLKDPKSVLNTLGKKASFWFPIFFHQKQDDTVEFT